MSFNFCVVLSCFIWSVTGVKSLRSQKFILCCRRQHRTRDMIYNDLQLWSKTYGSPLCVERLGGSQIAMIKQLILILLDGKDVKFFMSVNREILSQSLEIGIIDISLKCARQNIVNYPKKNYISVKYHHPESNFHIPSSTISCLTFDYARKAKPTRPNPESPYGRTLKMARLNLDR